MATEVLLRQNLKKKESCEKHPARVEGKGQKKGKQRKLTAMRMRAAKRCSQIEFKKTSLEQLQGHAQFSQLTAASLKMRKAKAQKKKRKLTTTV